MKKILSIISLAIAGLLSASASQTFTVTSVGNSQTIYFRINKTSGSVTRSKTTATGSNATVALTANETYYQTFAITTGSDTYKTITFTLPDDVTYLEVYNNQANVAALNVSGMASALISLNVSGCNNLATLTLGTMSALTDVNASGTKAAVANAFTATNSPALQSLNVAGCDLTAFSYAGANLYALDVTGNSLTALNLSAQTHLDILRCEDNAGLTTLTLPACVSTLSAKGCALTSVSGFGENMQVLDVAGNQLAQLGVDVLTNTTDLDVSDNHLTFRSLPSAENRPERMLYGGNDGQYDITGDMRPAFGSYSSPLQSRLPNYTSRSDADYTLDLSDDLLDGNGNKRVAVNFENGSGALLSQAVSGVDGNDYTIDADNDRYGFMKAQTQVRARFTDTDYPGLTLYSPYFTVPDGVSGTLKIVDEDGATLLTKDNAFFSDATDGLPDYARRDYTQYTIPAIPTVEGGTWTITAGPSDDAPFAWAKTYGSAVWYYMSVGSAANKWATAGERNGTDGTPYGGHALKASYDTSDNNYQWAFVGNQYDGFRIYNKGCGNAQTLQDYSGSSAPRSGGYFPIMRNGTSLTWVVRTNAAGTGFALENKGGGYDADYSVDAPCFLNNYAGMGYMNYWITSVYDAQNNAGSLINVTQASEPVAANIRWVMVDEDDNAVYSIVTDAEPDATVNSYPSELTTLAANRFVTLPTLTPFTVSSSSVEKRINYTWTGPFQISTNTAQHHYKLKIRNALYIVSDTRADGALDCVSNDDTTNPYRWMFYGDPFNGFVIRNFAKGTQSLTAANGTATDGTSYPTFTDGATRWIITSCTQAGIAHPFSVSPAGTTGVYWNQYGGTTNNQGLKYWTTNGTSDGGAAIEAVLIEDVVTMATLTWNVLDAQDNVVYTVTKDYPINSTVSEYPAELVALQTERFLSYPTLASFQATSSQSYDVPYSWAGPYELTTDIRAPKLYNVKSSRYGYYLHAPVEGEVGKKPTNQDYTRHPVSARDAWFFMGDPFNGIEIRTYANPTAGVDASWTLTSTPQKFIPRAAPDITTNYWNNPLSSAACGFVIPGRDEASYSSCIAENLGNWRADAITSDKGCSFTVEPADIDAIVQSGYYRIRSVGSGLTNEYLTMDESGNVQHSSDHGEAFHLEEQEDYTWRISHSIGGTPYYLDNTRTSYSQQLTTTTDAANAFGCTITYDSKTDGVPFFSIKVGAFTSYDSYSYMNINGSNTGVWTWNHTTGSADASAWTVEPVAPVTLNPVGGYSYATFYFDRDVQTDEDTKAYYITTTNNSYAQLTEVDNSGHNIPAYTAVVLINEKAATSKTFDVVSGFSPVVDEEDNLLKGTLTSMSLDLSDASSYYSLGKLNDEIGFYKFSGGTITLGANKAYLETPALGSEVKGFMLYLDEVDGMKTLARPQTDNVFFDISGRRVSKPGHGIYIVNGKKIVVK